MKNFTLIVSAILSAASPAVAEEMQPKTAIEQVVAPQKLGKEAIAQIRQDYEKGLYDEFLQESDASYQALLNENKRAEFAAFRQGQKPDANWSEKALLLQKERNQKLRELAGAAEAPFAQKILSAAAEQEEAFLRMAALRQMPLETGKNGEENQLIDLDLEYEYKSLHLDMPALQGETVADRREKHYVLKMEQANRMFAAAHAFSDTSLKQDVVLFTQNLDEQMAHSWDQTDLMALLLNGSAKSTSAIEDKVISILEMHQEKMGD